MIFFLIQITSDKNESVGINDNCDSKDEVIWKVGQKFTSIELVEACKTNYELKRHCQLVKSKVRSLEAAKKRIPKRIALANMALHYQTLQFVCKFSGKSSQPELERKRKTKSFRCGCPFEIVLELSVDNQHLQVVRVQEEHNHLVSQELYEHLPKQRTLSPDMMKNVKEAIQLKANSKHLQQKIELSSGKKCILKDIANLRQYSKVSFSDNEIYDIAEFLKQRKGSVVEVLVDSDKKFKGLFFQDSQMQKMYERYPEIINLFVSLFTLLSKRNYLRENGYHFSR
nr:uncharacterized protein LOC124807641 [Hydra vulgaris]